MKKRIAAAFIAAAMAVTLFSGIPHSRSSVTAQAADTDGTPYDPVLTDDNDTVVVVDAGHGGTDSGAIGNGFKEKNLTLKIAKALQARLQSYSHVKVYMSRNTDTYVGLSDRTAYAASVGADAFVSVHLNSGSSSAKGAEVWYPNSHYDSNCYEVGKAMATNIMDALQDLGLGRRGIAYKNSATGNKYPDGSLSDYYAVIRTSKLHHIPGIIIEGAFISSSSDVKNFLNTDAKLTAMGTADADAVAEALDLSINDGTEVIPDYTTLASATATGNRADVAVTWQPSANSSEYVVFRKTGASGKWGEVGRTSDTTFTDTSASYGKTYYYTVIGRNDNGRAASYDTNGLAVTTPRKDIPMVSAVDNGLKRVKVTWTADPDATGYRLYRSTDGGSYKKVTTIKKQATSYTDETVSKSSDYDYVVKSYVKTSHGNVWSTCKKPGASVTTDNDDVGTLTGTASADNTSITFTWQKSADPDVKYRLYRKEDDGSYTRIAETTEQTFTDTNIAPGTTYNYRLRYYRKALHSTSTYWSTYTNTVTFITPDTDDTSADTAEDATVTKIEQPVQAPATSKTTTSTVKKNESTIVMKDAIQRAFGKVAIHWNSSVPYKGSTDKVYYRVYRKNGNGSYKFLKDVTTKYATDNGAFDSSSDPYSNSTAATFTYRVRSYINDGSKKLWSPYSDEVSVTMDGSAIKLRSPYQAVKSSSDSTNYDNDVKDYVTPASETSLTIHWYPVQGATGYQILDANGKRVTSVKGEDINSLTITGLNARTSYTYMIRAYRRYQKKNYFGKKSQAATGTTPYVIKGTSNTNPAQMARYFDSYVKSKKKKAYPADTYAQYGAPDINTFSQIVYDEANRVGIKAEVLFAQICKETNFLTFGGDVKPEQCNFGGIGATGSGASGIDFVKYAQYYYSALGYATPDAATADAVRVGVRAQAVHLALYATTDGTAPSYSNVTAVNNYPNIGTVVVPDPRAGSWLIGYAPYVEWLGTKDNGYTTGEAASNGIATSKGWATANNYGYSLVTDYIEPLLRS